MQYLTSMHTAPQPEEYNNFLTWFEIEYPALSNRYHGFITIPNEGEGVQVTQEGLILFVCEQLVQIEHDYYHPWRAVIR
jgi:hypothetical protein